MVKVSGFCNKLTELQQEVSPFRIYIQKEVPMLENLLEYYRKSDGYTKKKILGCIFAEKLVLEKGKVATPVFTESVKLILKMSEALRNSDNENDIHPLMLSHVTLGKDSMLQLL